MKRIEYYLIIFLTALLLIFRLTVVFTTALGIKFAVVSLNINLEIILLFLMLLSIILMAKTKLLGAIILLVSSILYYGGDLYNTFINSGTIALTQDYLIQNIASLIGIIIPLFSFFIIAFAKEQEKRPVDKKTDFFYKNPEYDRDKDKRADKNNYRIY